MRGSFAIVLAVVAGSCFAQKGVGAPPDVPKNHWAYEAVDEMFKLGLLVGYPNGSFNGSRPVSRYELAEAMDALDRLFEPMTPAHPDRVKGSSKDLQSMKDELISLDLQLAAMKHTGSDLAALQKSLAGLKEHMSTVKADAKELKAGLEKAKS